MINNDVLHGNNGWLFLYNGSQKQFGYLTGQIEVSPLSVNNFSSNIKDRREFCASRGISYQHIVFPSKPLVKKHNLPEDCSNVNSLYLSYYAKKISSEDNVLYPLQELLEYDELHSTFYKYDTHNTDLGYFRVVDLSLRELECSVDLYSYISRIVMRRSGGDLAQMCSYKEKSNEECIILDQVNPYSIGNRGFLASNTNDVLITYNKNSLSNKRLLVFGDSFIKGTLHYYALFFREILYVRSSFLHKDIVELHSPDVVITSNAERYLSNVKNDYEARNFILSLYGNNKYTPSMEYLKAFKACLSYKYHPALYNEWVCNIDDYIQYCEFNRIADKLSGISDSADILRECALAFEKSGDYRSAITLMEKAHALRPKGVFIKRKLDEYLAK